MKNTLKIFGLLTALFISANALAQISGNQVYQQNNNNNSYISAGQLSSRNSITATESGLLITTSVLLNAEPDAVIVTLGLNQEAKTVKECNEKINERIKLFSKKIKSLGVKEADVYVDFISQTKIYDYEVSQTQAKQMDMGFEIKKNIIVRLADLKAFDALTSAASEYEIYDIVKAEYINEDIEAIYSNIFDEALKVINAKKDKYVKAFKADLSDDFRMTENNYYSVQPKSQYREYKAFESSDLSVSYNYNNNNGANYVRKEQRKNRTFYYQGIDTAMFDKVINPSNPVIGIQYVIEMKVQYHIKR